MRPEKHSLTLQGHRTSVSLERPFWDAFCALAWEKGQPINAMAATLDAQRGTENGLATEIRLFVLRELQQKLEHQKDNAPDD